ncbi:unnamed protein product [Medioppia subpectinata]|uniref:Uncharacterized protein n=1 Tax=Medioppia subpectinata TaxID=1979941 RepID=A0A7R9QHS4_9ACAR|nr:unnamed protein product [Medioppia subpectinata]CAG2120518.1 unnamed protein product [Medioppia subpectinata]
MGRGMRRKASHYCVMYSTIWTTFPSI